MKANQLVSIIVPAYNVENKIEVSLRSCINQTYKNLEIIVVDDGSTDDTLFICKKLSLSDKRIIVIHSNNQGVSNARNIGIEKSSGKWLTFLDSDDELETDAIEFLLECAVKSNSDVAIGRIKEIDQDKIIKKDYYFKNILWKGSEALVEYLKGNNPLSNSACGKLYSKEIIGNTRFVYGRKVHEDTFFVFNIFIKKPNVIANNKTVYMYMIRNDSASRQEYSDKFLDIIYFAEERTQMVDSNNHELMYLANNALIRSYLAYLKICISKNARDVKKYEMKCIYSIKKLKQYYLHSTKKESIFFYLIIYNLYFVVKHLFNICKKTDY